MKRSAILFVALGAVVLFAAGCGGKSNKGASSGGGGKGGTFILRANDAPSGSPDPQIDYTLQEWQFLIDTHDGLLAFKRVSGPEGTKLVPDLAEAMPTISDGGKTLKFTLRPNIKYSNGMTVKASDVKTTYARLFKVNSPNAGAWYSIVVGGDACLKTPKTCNLSQGVVTDDAARTVTFHLTRPNGEFLDQLAMPFMFLLPPNTPDKPVNIPPPGTGPYKWVAYNPNKEMRIVRNPYFKVWSKEAQPPGNPDEIVEKFGLTVEAEVTEVEQGRADAIPQADHIPTDRLPELSSKFPDQVHISPIFGTWYMALNTRIPPFNNLQARQAVNYATDRNALVKIYGGPKLATPTCQVLPPEFPGYKPYCPYTTSPGSGKWTGPDMAKAKQLVKASGTAGATVKVNSDNDPTDRAYAVYFRDLLNSLGYKAKLQILASSIQYPYVQNSKHKVEMAFSDWFADYPGPSDFLDILLGCDSFHPNSNASPNIAEFCNRSIQSQMTRSLAQAATAPAAANRSWAKVDQTMTDQAPWVSMFNPKYLDFVSKRVKNYQFSPQWYFLIDQASIK